MAKPKQLKVRCSIDGDTLIQGSDAVIDDDTNTYKFTCPVCGHHNAKRMDDVIRDILRNVGAPTIEELCQSFAATLEDDRNVVRALLR